MKKNDIRVCYYGDYPCLCGGDLSIIINGKKYKFPKFCLKSGGSCGYSFNGEEYITEGPWDITKWPEKFPENLKTEVLEEINNQIRHGCCGGCL